LQIAAGRDERETLGEDKAKIIVSRREWRSPKEIDLPSGGDVAVPQARCVGRASVAGKRNGLPWCDRDDYTTPRSELVREQQRYLHSCPPASSNCGSNAPIALADAEPAHRDLDGRKTTGKLLLLP